MRFFKPARPRLQKAPQPSILSLLIRWLGCLLLAIFIIAASCGGAFALLTWLTQRARAQTLNQVSQITTPHNHLILLDQSGSVMNFPSTRALMRTTTKQVVEQLRGIDSATGSAAGVIRIDTFGATRRNVLPAMPLQDPTLNATLEAGLPTWESLGATEFSQLLTSVLSDTEPVSDVVLITDGIPDPVSRTDLAVRRAYAEQLLNIARQFAQRGIPVVVVLIGEANRAEWTTVWQSFAEVTGGNLIEARTAANLEGPSPFIAVLNPAPSAVPPTATMVPSPTHTRLPPTPTSTVTATPTPTAPVTPTQTPAPKVPPTLTTVPIAPTVPPTAIPTLPLPSPAPPTLVPSPQPSATTVPTSGISAYITPLSFIGLCAGSLVLLVVLAVVTTAAHRREQAMQRAALPVDEGVIEIQGTETYSVQQIDLSSMALGEVWHIGEGTDCDIQLALCKANDSPVAALVMTEAGPLLESRGEPLIYEGRAVQRHPLQDDDQVHLDCYVLRYQNLLRRREPVFDATT